MKIVAVKLKKHDLIWWETLKKKHEREGPSKIKTKENVRWELSCKFLLDHYYQDNFV